MTAMRSPFFLAALHAVACTFPSVAFRDGGNELSEGSMDGTSERVGSTEDSGPADTALEAGTEATTDATAVDATSEDATLSAESGNDVLTAYDDAMSRAEAGDGGVSDAAAANCDCGPGQSPYPTGITCGLLNLGQCNATAGFVDTPACGQEGMWVQCMMSTLVLCVPGAPQPKLQQCQ